MDLAGYLQRRNSVADTYANTNPHADSDTDAYTDAYTDANGLRSRMDCRNGV